MKNTHVPIETIKTQGCSLVVTVTLLHYVLNQIYCNQTTHYITHYIFQFNSFYFLIRVQPTHCVDPKYITKKIKSPTVHMLTNLRKL